jgi:lipoyl(octanoyl) transferase
MGVSLPTYSTLNEPVVSIWQPCQVYTASFLPVNLYSTFIASSTPNISADPWITFLNHDTLIVPCLSVSTSNRNSLCLGRSNVFSIEKMLYKVLGMVGYAKALKLQEFLKRHPQRIDLILLLEHPPTFTAGRRMKDSFCSVPGAAFYSVDRGGQLTFHGPGQLIGYPLIDLRSHNLGVRSYVDRLQESLILACSHFGIRAISNEVHTGVWVGRNKIAALGIHVQRHLTSHGFALNCSTDLNWFDHIVPCGLKDRKPTSLSVECNRVVTVDQAIPVVMNSISRLFASNTQLLKDVAPHLDREIDLWLASQP